MGGDFDTVSKPYKRKFNDRRRHRKVKITVNRHVPHPHYYVSIVEEENPVWCTVDHGFGEKPHWHHAWEDPNLKGVSFDKRCNTAAYARHWIEKILAEEFPNHKADWGWGSTKRWFYSEGD